VLEGYEDVPRTGQRARPALAATRVGPVAGSPALQQTVRLPTQKVKTRSPAAGIFIAVVLAALGVGTYMYRDRLGFERFGAQPVAATKKDTTPPARDTSANTAVKTLPRLDSASNARKLAADSLAAATAKADSLLRAPLDRYAKAFNSGNAEGVIQTYPTMPDPVREQVRNIMAIAEKIRATATYQAPTITDNRAELPFQVHLRFNPKGRLESTTALLKYHAVLTRENAAGAWKISQLTIEP
jgi:hypothetical protein